MNILARRKFLSLGALLLAGCTQRQEKPVITPPKREVDFDLPINFQAQMN